MTVTASTPTPQMGELLYPGFNSIVPHFVEYVLPNMHSLSSKEASMLITAFYQLLDFAFRTQIFRQAQLNVAQASNFVNGNNNPAASSSCSLQNLLLASKQLILEANANASAAS